MVSSTVQLLNGNLSFSLSENMPVTVSIYDVGGRQIYSGKKAYCSGAHVIQAQLKSAGIYLYRVQIGKEEYSFKYLPFGM
jgi:hypothetical protein